MKLDLKKLLLNLEHKIEQQSKAVHYPIKVIHKGFDGFIHMAESTVHMLEKPFVKEKKDK